MVIHRIFCFALVGYEWKFFWLDGFFGVGADHRYSTCDNNLSRLRENILGEAMKKKTPKIIPALGPEFCQIFKRKAGAHPHRNVKRKKTRQKFLRLQTIMREY